MEPYYVPGILNQLVSVPCRNMCQIGVYNLMVYLNCVFSEQTCELK